MEQLDLFNESGVYYCDHCGVVEVELDGIYCESCCDAIVEWLQAAWIVTGKLFHTVS